MCLSSGTQIDHGDDDFSPSIRKSRETPTDRTAFGTGRKAETHAGGTFEPGCWTA